MEEGLLARWFGRLVEALKGARNTPSAPVPPGARSTLPFTIKVDGNAIRGKIIYPSQRPSKLYPAVIFCHGIPGPPAPPSPGDGGYEELAEHFCALGAACVIFNFRGCGESEGNFDMMGWVRDLGATLDKVWETPHVDPTRILVVGYSGGGAAAICAAAEDDRVYALASVSAPADLSFFGGGDPKAVVEDFRSRGIIRDAGFPQDVELWMRGFEEIEPVRWIAHFKGKRLLIAHGAEDELIPVAHARRLFDAAPKGTAELEIIPGAPHKLRRDVRCRDILVHWVKDVVGHFP
jgi:pimeloyl-ACP methyl ester carboxylesterase